jgi:CDP-6-deoxy-D-xylo-4-hexulose-3-dehydrase
MPLKHSQGEAMVADVAAPARLDWPLMEDNVTADDLAAVREFLSADDLPILTQSKQVQAFERQWSDWLGVKHSVFVNSGSSANLITLAALRWRLGPGEIILPPLTWVSDVAAVLHNGFKPVFVDIDLTTLGLDLNQVLDRITDQTRAVFLTHILGYDALTDEFLAELQGRGVALIEDVCESHGATHSGRKLGSLGLMSNFSFYYAHHMSTIEGGMVCTNDDDYYECLRMLRSHGMVREASNPAIRDYYRNTYDDLNPDFIFAQPAYNVRSTEINAVMGQSQLKRLDQNNDRRRHNLDLFLDHLDPAKYYVEFRREGSCNYAFTLLLREANDIHRDNVVTLLRKLGVEFRRGMSGGGNQLRQPYLREHLPHWNPAEFANVEHVHFYGFYLGNYPTLPESKILSLCDQLNALPTDRHIS